MRVRVEVLKNWEWSDVCEAWRHGDIFGGMAAMVEMHHTGCDPGVRAEIVALIEHVLSSRPGDWRVSIIGSQANDRWEMKISGPNGFERSYTLEGRAGEHQPEVIRGLLNRLLPGRMGT